MVAMTIQSVPKGWAHQLTSTAVSTTSLLARDCLISCRQSGGIEDMRERCYDRNKVWWMWVRCPWKRGKKEMTIEMFLSLFSTELQSADGIFTSTTQRSSLRGSTRVLTPNRHHHTCPVVQMELVCVGAVEGVGDLAISSHVWIWCRNLQHKHAGGRVFHHRLCVHQLGHGDNNNNQASICIALFSVKLLSAG